MLTVVTTLVMFTVFLQVSAILYNYVDDDVIKFVQLTTSDDC